MIIVFDLFGVLLSSGFRSSQQRLKQLFERDLDQIAPVYRKWEIPFDLDRINSKQFWTNINQELGTNVSWKILNEAVLESYHPLPGSLELLKRYRKHFPLYLLSNTRREWFDYLDRKYNLSSFFQKTFLSCNIGVRKPAPEIYHYLLDALNAEPTDIFFIDDELPNVISARNIGITSVVFQSAFETELLLHGQVAFDVLDYDE